MTTYKELEQEAKTRLDEVIKEKALARIERSIQNVESAKKTLETAQKAHEVLLQSEIDESINYTY